MTSNQTTNATIYLGRIYTPLSGGGWLDIPNGALAINEFGRIENIGIKEDIINLLPNYKIVDYQSFLITPGFVDCHQHLCHYDWARLIPNLMDWLKHIYEIEARFEDTKYAFDVSCRFFSNLIRHGTTTCCVHGPYFINATETAFQVASKMGLRVLIGMNTGDMNVPNPLNQPASKAIEDALHLYNKWHGAEDGLLSYCFTVRPAYCASKELLSRTAQVASHLQARIQSHLAEDHAGQQEILQYFPKYQSDTEVYLKMGILGPSTIMAHGIYLSDKDFSVLSRTGTSIAHCPRANLLAGGKQMNFHGARSHNIGIGLGTDLGGSKGLSMFRVMEDAIKVNSNLSVHDTMRMATLDGAKILRLADRLGSLEKNREADFLVLYPKILEHNKDIKMIDIEDLLSSLIFCGDDRDITLVNVRGKKPECLLA